MENEIFAQSEQCPIPVAKSGLTVRFRSFFLSLLLMNHCVPTFSWYLSHLLSIALPSQRRQYYAKPFQLFVGYEHLGSVFVEKLSKLWWTRCAPPDWVSCEIDVKTSNDYAFVNMVKSWCYPSNHESILDLQKAGCVVLFFPSEFVMRTGSEFLV